MEKNNLFIKVIAVSAVITFTITTTCYGYSWNSLRPQATGNNAPEHARSGASSVSLNDEELKALSLLELDTLDSVVYESKHKDKLRLGNMPRINDQNLLECLEVIAGCVEDVRKNVLRLYIVFSKKGTQKLALPPPELKVLLKILRFKVERGKGNKLFILVSIEEPQYDQAEEEHHMDVLGFKTAKDYNRAFYESAMWLAKRGRIEQLESFLADESMKSAHRNLQILIVLIQTGHTDIAKKYIFKNIRKYSCEYMSLTIEFLRLLKIINDKDAINCLVKVIAYPKAIKEVKSHAIDILIKIKKIDALSAVLENNKIPTPFRFHAAKGLQELKAEKIILRYKNDKAAKIRRLARRIAEKAEMITKGKWGRYKRAHKQWVVERIGEIYKQRGYLYAGLAEENYPILYETALRLFKTWAKALSRAGLNKSDFSGAFSYAKDPKFTGRFDRTKTEKQLFAAISRMKQREGKIPSIDVISRRYKNVVILAWRLDYSNLNTALEKCKRKTAKKSAGDNSQRPSRPRQLFGEAVSYDPLGRMDLPDISDWIISGIGPNTRRLAHKNDIQGRDGGIFGQEPESELEKLLRPLKEKDEVSDLKDVTDIKLIGEKLASIEKAKKEDRDYGYYLLLRDALVLILIRDIAYQEVLLKDTERKVTRPVFRKYYKILKQASFYAAKKLRVPLKERWDFKTKNWRKKMADMILIKVMAVFLAFIDKYIDAIFLEEAIKIIADMADRKMQGLDLGDIQKKEDLKARVMSSISIFMADPVVYRSAKSNLESIPLFQAIAGQGTGLFRKRRVTKTIEELAGEKLPEAAKEKEAGPKEKVTAPKPEVPVPEKKEPEKIPLVDRGPEILTPEQLNEVLAELIKKKDLLAKFNIKDAELDWISKEEVIAKRLVDYLEPGMKAFLEDYIKLLGLTISWTLQKGHEAYKAYFRLLYKAARTAAELRGKEEPDEIREETEGILAVVFYHYLKNVEKIKGYAEIAFAPLERKRIIDREVEKREPKKKTEALILRSMRDKINTCILERLEGRDEVILWRVKERIKAYRLKQAEQKGEAITSEIMDTSGYMPGDKGGPEPTEGKAEKIPAVVTPIEAPLPEEEVEEAPKISLGEVGPRILPREELIEILAKLIKERNTLARFDVEKKAELDWISNPKVIGERLFNVLKGGKENALKIAMNLDLLSLAISRTMEEGYLAYRAYFKLLHEACQEAAKLKLKKEKDADKETDKMLSIIFHRHIENIEKKEIFVDACLDEEFMKKIKERVDEQHLAKPEVEFLRRKRRFVRKRVILYLLKEDKPILRRVIDMVFGVGMAAAMESGNIMQMQIVDKSGQSARIESSVTQAITDLVDALKKEPEEPEGSMPSAAGVVETPELKLAIDTAA